MKQLAQLLTLVVASSSRFTYSLTAQHFVIRQSPAMNEWLGISSCLCNTAASELERLQTAGGGQRKLDDAMRGAVIRLLRQTAYNCDAVQGSRPSDTIVITSRGYRVPEDRMPRQQLQGKAAPYERKEGESPVDSRRDDAKQKKPSIIKKIKQLFTEP